MRNTNWLCVALLSLGLSACNDGSAAGEGEQDQGLDASAVDPADQRVADVSAGDGSRDGPSDDGGDGFPDARPELEPDGQGRDATRPDGSPDVSSPDAAVDPCDGVSCQANEGPMAGSRGECFVDTTGAPACDCIAISGNGEAAYFGSADLACLSREAYCLDGFGYSCMGDAICLPETNFLDGCPVNCATGAFRRNCSDRCDAERPWSENRPEPLCWCQQAGEAYSVDAEDCVPDVRACPELMPSDMPTYRFNVEGDAEFVIVNGQGSDYNWAAGGGIQFFNEWPAAICGSVGYSGRSAEPGRRELSSLDLFIAYDGKTWRSRAPGAAGFVDVEALEWCGDFDCTVIELSIDGTMADEDGGLITVGGFIRGVF